MSGLRVAAFDDLTPLFPPLGARVRPMRGRMDEAGRFSEERIIGVLKEADAGAMVLDLCRKQGMSSATFYAWKSKYNGLELSDAKRLRRLEEENSKLTRLLADLMLDNADPKDLLGKNDTPSVAIP